MAKKSFDLSKSDHFILIGIASHESDLRVAWEINKATELNLRKENDIEITVDSEIQRFTKNYYFDQENNIEYQLIGNTSENGFLLKSFKNLDYFLKINGEISETHLSRIVNNIKSSEDILSVFKLDNDSSSKFKRISGL